MWSSAKAAATVPRMLDAPSIRDHLAAWYHTRRRRLPWREDPSPYRVWVSEIMLQQTRVATVLPYFERFVAAFPDVRALAAADEADVLSLWAGLGYYQRCRRLHAAAQAVVAAHGGEVPSSVEALRALPGIGRYTAGAIASIAFGRVEPLLDGNVARVLARLLALEEAVDGAAGTRALWAAATELVCPRDPSSHNQALMELGALICSPKTPECVACPVAGQCAARVAGAAERYPIKRPRRRPTPALAVAGLVCDQAGRVLLARRPEGVLLGGLWELPGGDLELRAGQRDGLRTLLEERVGLQASVGRHLGRVEHVFTHRHLTLEVFHVDAWAGQLRAGWYPDLRWLPGEALRSVPLSRLTEKVLATLGYHDAA